MSRRRERVDIVGFTSHRSHSGFENPDREIWGLNDLYIDMPVISNDRLRWFQIHDWNEGRPVESATDLTKGPVHPRDPSHVEWLSAQAKEIPVYFLNPRPEVPDARLLDMDAMNAYFSLDGETPFGYWTNTISYMIGLAIMEGFKEIGVYGVDMMMGGGDGSEYGYQRPSCEFFLGWARGAGIKVHLPAESDLLKTAYAYGDTQGNDFRTKVKSMLTEYTSRLGQVRNQKQQMVMAEAELTGAKNFGDWVTRSWMPGDGDESLGRVPEPDAHKEIPGPVEPPL